MSRPRQRTAPSFALTGPVTAGSTWGRSFQLEKPAMAPRLRSGGTSAAAAGFPGTLYSCGERLCVSWTCPAVAVQQRQLRQRCH